MLLSVGWRSSAGSSGVARGGEAGPSLSGFAADLNVRRGANTVL
jgi:hypothetical protein